MFHNFDKQQGQFRRSWSSSGASPQTLYHVSVASTSRSTTWLPDFNSIVCKFYLKTKDELCKLDGVLVSIQSYIKTHILDFTIKSNMSVAKRHAHLGITKQQSIVNVYSTASLVCLHITYYRTRISINLKKNSFKRIEIDTVHIITHTLT